MKAFLLVLGLVCVQHAAGEGKCRVTKVRAVCESHCQEDSQPVDKTSVPPPGTLLPPAMIPSNQNEGTSPGSYTANNSTAADSSSLLEIESQMEPAITVTKTQSGKFLEQNIPKATNQVALPTGMSGVHSSRLVFPDMDMQNLNEISAQHFATAPATMVLAPMTCDDVEGHISPAPLLSWTNAATVSFGCTDGRVAEEGVFTWGGDFGEFVTALNVYEQMATIRLSQADVTAIFRKYLEVSQRERFTTCMSSLSVKQLFGAVDDLEVAIKNPPEEKRAALWMKISDSNFFGNDHIKFMLDDPLGYSVRKELIQQFIHSFFDIYWNHYDPLQSKLRVQVLIGDHQERAIVSVTVPDFCIQQANLAALISPRLPSTNIAIINSDVIQVLRKELSIFFSRETTPVVGADELNKRFNVLATGQGAKTRKMMFDRIPSYTAKIS